MQEEQGPEQSLLPVDRRTAAVVLASLALTAAIWLAMSYQRAGLQPYAIPVFRHLLFFQDYYTVLPFVVILLAALAAPFRAAGMRVASWCGRNVGPVALAAAAASAVGTWGVYHLHPLSMDEYAVLFQARAFAEARLTGQIPPALLDWVIPQWMYEFFRVNAQTGTVAAGYWPGFSALLAPLAALGAPWLINPLIAAATLLVLHRLALELFGDLESAGLVVLLTLASPVFTINAMSLYSTPARLLANALFLLLLLRATPARAFLAGLVGSVALVLQNPVPHLLFALPFIAWLAWRPGRVKLLGALAAGYLPVSLFVGWGWAEFIHTLAAPAATAAAPAGVSGVLSSRLGGVLGASRTGAAEAHFLSLYKLWLWAVPGLVAVAALGFWRQRKGGGLWLALGASVLLTYFAYFLVRFDQGHGWGARYFHSAWLAVPLFAVAALQESIKAAADGPPARDSLAGYLAGCAVLSLVVLTAFRALQVEQFISRQRAQLPTAASGTPRVVIIDPRVGYFSWDLAQNDPFLRNPVLYLTSRHPQLDEQMMAAQFPQYRLLGADARGSVWGLPDR